MYGKIFDSMYDGTLYGHWQAIVTLQQMIVLADADGIVDMTPQAIAARTSIPLEIILKGLEVLSEPDPYTRTPGEEGRRIILLDDHRPWGWKLVNHGKYKRLRDAAQKREADRARIAKKRKENKGVATTSQGVADVAHTDTDTDTTPLRGVTRARARDAAPYEPSDSTKKWTVDAGVPEELLKRYVAYFRDYIAQPKNRRRYVDLDAAFRNCVRGDWGDTRKQWERERGTRGPAPKPEDRSCVYCGEPRVGVTNGYSHCRAHTNSALDGVRPPERATA